MDRNSTGLASLTVRTVALRKESVDRNAAGSWRLAMNLLSLSARRAWIEIAYGALDGASEIVALRKESVDRNTNWTSIGRP